MRRLPGLMLGVLVVLGASVVQPVEGLEGLELPGDMHCVQLDLTMEGDPMTWPVFASHTASGVTLSFAGVSWIQPGLPLLRGFQWRTPLPYPSQVWIHVGMTDGTTHVIGPVSTTGFWTTPNNPNPPFVDELAWCVPWRCSGRVATIVGTAGADTLTGTPRSDVIVGLSGEDTISGLGGSDLICGGRGGDWIDGGDGIDRVWGDSGADTLRGGPGDDQLRGGAGDDQLRGGVGIDVADGGPGIDSCWAETMTTCE